MVRLRTRLRHSLLHVAALWVLLSVGTANLAGAEEPTREQAPSTSVSQPGARGSKASLAKSITLYSLYGASGASLLASGVFGWKSLDKKNEADTEAQLGPRGFCTSLVGATCSHYANLREDQNALALRAWGFLGTSTLLALSGLAVGEFWPNERYTVTASFRPEDGGGVVAFGMQWGL